MRATAEDHLVGEQSGKRGLPLRWLFAAGLILLALGYFWPESSDVEQEPPPSVEKVVTPVPAEPAPDIARRPPAASTPPPEPYPEDVSPMADTQASTDLLAEQEPVPALPSEEESNALMLAAARDIGLANPEQLLVRDTPLPDSAALIDAVGRGYLLRRLITAEVNGSFAVEERDEQIFMAPIGYRRYDTLVQSIAALDIDSAVAHFHELRPLYERAFDQLGLDPEEFDNAVIRSLDQVLSTPIIEAPIELQRESVMYTYADPQLQSMNGVQKHLLRMGPDNIRLLQETAQRLRDGLLSEQ